MVPMSSFKACFTVCIVIVQQIKKNKIRFFSERLPETRLFFVRPVIKMRNNSLLASILNRLEHFPCLVRAVVHFQLLGSFIAVITCTNKSKYAWAPLEMMPFEKNCS